MNMCTLDAQKFLSSEQWIRTQILEMKFISTRLAVFQVNTQSTDKNNKIKRHVRKTPRKYISHFVFSKIQRLNR